MTERLSALTKLTREREEYERMVARFSIASALRGATCDGLEKGTVEHAVHHRSAPSESFDGRTFTVPWSVLCRDLNVASPTAGGYLVDEPNLSVAEMLRPYSLVVQAGASVQTGLHGAPAVPEQLSRSAGYWLSSEASALTPSTPTWGQIALSPKTCGALVKYSRQLQLQASQSLEALLRRDLLVVVGALLDTAVLNGNGMEQPLGLLSTITPTSGASLSWSDALAMRKTVADGNAREDAVAWIASTDVREVLAQREVVDTSGRFIWTDGKVDGRPANVTTSAPAGTLALGDWSQLLVGIWGPGPQIAVDPNTDFVHAKTSMRVLLSCDVAYRNRDAFAVATSVS